MASKREREEAETEEMEDLKRQKSYSQMVRSLLEEEGEEAIEEDLSSIMATLQQEISSVSSDHNQDSVSVEEILEEEVEMGRVMRHLLEASDDELGIPNPNGDEFLVGDGLWELEDEAANYDTFFHSHLFM